MVKVLEAGGAKGADFSHKRDNHRNVDRCDEEVKPKPAKAVRGNDIFNPDELNRMHRSLMATLGVAHPMVTNLQKAIDDATVRARQQSWKGYP